MTNQTALQKAEKEVTRVHAILALKIDVIRQALLPENVQSLTERVVTTHVQKLDEAIVLYEDSIVDVYAAAPEDDAKKKTYSDKLMEQLGIVNPLLDKLQEVKKNLNTPAKRNSVLLRL